MKNIFIIGSQGYDKNYGGWETFVKNLCDFYDKKETNFYVTELSTKKEKRIYKKNQITCIPIYTKDIGNATMLINSIKAYFSILRYIRKNKINKPLIYILGLRQGPILFFTRKYVKRHGIKIAINPDGLEWKRSKWNKLIKFYFKYSEWTMIRNCDLVICDSKGIKDYISKKYTKIKVPLSFIAYGTKNFDFSNVNEKEILNEYGLKKRDYCLVVGRCVPENNLELIIKEFMNSKIEKKLIIISNITGNNYYEILINKTNCLSDNRIKIYPGIYDEIKLATIRKNSFLYIHGHSVGGTNPSLLEALSLTDLNLLYDVNFNKYVGKNSCLYFSEKNNSLTRLLDQEDYLKSITKKKAKLARQIVKMEYTWEGIVEKYKKIFDKMF